ncbi:Alpha/Beta hydrolase protein [Mycena epipterygia]|nr:Alpha/Beta hydrolase protein [Mycena epipterygia]
MSQNKFGEHRCQIFKKQNSRLAVYSNPPQCYQGTLGASPTNPVARDDAQSEDCLFLSIYSPALNTTKLLPTIVWIHGGGYSFGSSSDYNGAELVQESNREVVVVVIQYRLGLFGFLVGQHVKDGGALNAGLFDQKFCPTLDCEIWTLFNDVATQAGCNDTNSLECLRAVDAALLQEINLDLIMAGFTGMFTFVPVVDGSFITQSPTDALVQGELNGDILLSVTNTHEGNLFVNQSVECDVAQYVRELFPLFGVTEIAAVASIYRSVGSALDQRFLYVLHTYRLLNAFPGDSYKGEFAVPPALHGDDVFYYFPSFTGFPGSAPFNNTAFTSAFTQGFLSFAANLDPNTKLRPSIAPVWRKRSLAADAEMVFNRTEIDTPWIAAAPTSRALLSRCE